MAYVPSSENRTALGRAFDERVLSDPDAVCKVNGRAHRYDTTVCNTTLVVFTCQCGDVQWKERPQQEKP